MRIGLITYHKNLGQYPAKWIDKFRDSILNQTRNDFAIMELNYGGTEERIFENSYYESFPLLNFVHAMNYLLDKCLSGGFDCVGNCNIDDYFSLDRFEKQIPYIESGFDVVSSNFCLVKDDEIVHTHQFHQLNIKDELHRNHNPVCHPVVMYSKRFIENNRYDPLLVPYEDMILWEKSIYNGYKFIILKDILCYHRLHDKSVGHNLKEV